MSNVTGPALAAREIFRAGYLDFAFAQLCHAQEFLEAHGGRVGITPPNFFAGWRMSLENAFYIDEPWNAPKEPVSMVGA